MSDPPEQISLDAPAKLNLGLEILRRRPDGFHDLATIFLTIDIVDRLTVSPSDQISLECSEASLAGDENLAVRALGALRDVAGVEKGARVALQKAIPAAAGLGGASSDAAAALLAGRRLWGLKISDANLAKLGAALGSDIPFFLRGGCAAGRGRGERLAPLPLPAPLWFVVVVPHVVISRKTATLYGQLRSGDFSDGSRMAAQEAAIAAEVGLDLALLGNAFTRPLYELAPELAALPGIMQEAGAPVAALSGAGPAHYAPFADPHAARQTAARLRERLASRATLFVTRPVPERSIAP